MRVIRGAGLGLLLLAASAGALGAQGAEDASRDVYFGAVAEFFQLPRSEVQILGEWRLPAQEIPVVLFLARRAGISPEALVALRGSGRGWAELAGRYQLDASHFHVPLPAVEEGGSLRSAYAKFRAVPPNRWREVVLTDADIVGLVNLRLLAQTLERAPEDILAVAGRDSWPVLYARLIGDVQ